MVHAAAVAEHARFAKQRLPGNAAHLWDEDLPSNVLTGMVNFESWEAAHGHALIHHGEGPRDQRLQQMQRQYADPKAAHAWRLTTPDNAQ